MPKDNNKKKKKKKRKRKRRRKEGCDCVDTSGDANDTADSNEVVRGLKERLTQHNTAKTGRLSKES